MREKDGLVLDLWLDPADHPIDIRCWILKQFDRWLALLKDPRAPETLEKLKDPETLAATITHLPRRHPARVVLGNLKDKNVLAALYSWAADIARDEDPSASLYDPHSGMLLGLLKAVGLPTTFSVPGREINPEMLSVAYLLQLAKEADDEEFSQLRCDCRAIATLVEALEAVDWNAVSRALDHDAAFVAVTSSEPPSYRARRAERHARRRNQLQPAAIRLALAFWKSADRRAMLMLGLLYFRRSPKHGKILSEIIALSHCALAQFPRRSPRPVT
jgi:hypothetical protein